MQKIDLGKFGGTIKSPIKSMNLNKGTLVSIVIIIATVAIGGFLLVTKKDSLFSGKDSASTSVSSVQLKFTEKSLKLDYSSLAKDFVANIAGFEKNEDWQGSSEFDDVLFWQGESSLVMSSRDNEKIEAYLPKTLDLGKYQVFKLAAYLQTDPADIEAVRIYFANKDKTAYFSYPVTNLTKGWNFIRIPKIKFSSVNAVKENLIKPKTAQKTVTPSAVKETVLLSWDKIERVGIELTARSNSTATINLDELKALETEDYLDDWLVANPVYLDLVKTSNGEIILQSRGMALIKKLSGITNFSFKAKLQPLKASARSGFIVRGDYKTNYGYYFLIDGVNGNRWQIQKYGLADEKAVTTIIKNGVVNNFLVEKDKPLWLKVEAKGSNLKFYLSVDGKSFTRLGEINDGEYKEGGVGIAVFDSGATLFDGMEFSQ
ncbi:hypothetical protein FJY90_00205 [Candidatus Gottesmanbacteria bacterium]|nr:hypothetical protein [Candidatus Gottesmanbacteria bacterium]